MNYNTIKKLFPTKLTNQETFSIFVELASKELSQVFDYISLMTTLSNVDRCPEIFISHLAELVDFDWTDLLGSEEQRECLKYSWDAHNKYKGTKEDLELMATYGDIEGYQGGRLFVPGTANDTEYDPGADLFYYEDTEEFFVNHTYFLQSSEDLIITNSAYTMDLIELDETSLELLITSQKPRAVVTLPRESLFTFNESELDGEHYIPDNIVYKEGTIMIEITRLTDEIKRKVETVKPAGMLVVYKYVKDNKIEYITHTKTSKEVNE